MRRVVTIDIESLPALKNPASGEGSESEIKADNSFLKTALNGDFGRILCIGYLEDKLASNLVLEEKQVIGWDTGLDKFISHESALLKEFWYRLKGFNLR
jgi:hypothetical protein